MSLFLLILISVTLTVPPYNLRSAVGATKHLFVGPIQLLEILLYYIPLLSRTRTRHV